MAMRHHTPGSCCCPPEQGPCDPYPDLFDDDFTDDLSLWGTAPIPFWQTDSGYLEQYKGDWLDTGRKELLTPIRWQQPIVLPRVSAIDLEADFTTGDPMGFRHASHVSRIGFYPTLASPLAISFHVLHVYDEIEGAGFYTIFRFVGTTGSIVQSSTIYPGSHILRILIERTPNTTPQSWGVTFFIDGVSVWDGDTTIPNQWDAEPCFLSAGYTMEGETIVIGTVRHPSGFVRFKSNYFTVGVTYET